MDVKQERKRDGSGTVENDVVRFLVDIIEYQVEMIFTDPENSVRHWETLEVS
jgi:hypothetical protein